MTARVDVRTGLRRVQEVWRSQPTMEGAGVHLKRAFGFHQVPKLDPFLMLDSFGSGNPADYTAGFPWHPHRGIETITYMLEGEVEHGDSMGNKGVIRAGGIQWMTAGSGIIHQEMPRGDTKGRNAGFQLWANLPKSEKMMAPRYREVEAGQVPVVTANGATVRIVAGDVGGVKGPVAGIVTDPQLLDVTIAPGSTFTHPVAGDHTVFAYVFEGEGFFDAGREPFEAEKVGRGGNAARAVGEGTLVKWGDGEEIAVATEAKPVRFLLAAGKPLNEPIAWGGPIVMNTEAELQTAFREFRDGKFVKAR